MNPFALPQAPFMAALGWALVHFLWQGALIALVLALADAGLPRADARLRYGLACAAMALMVVSATGTFAMLWAATVAEPIAGAGRLARAGAGSFAAVGGDSVALNVGLQARFAPWLQWLDTLWLAGVLVLSARSMFGWAAAQRLTARSESLTDPVWEQRARRLAAALGISKPIRLSKSLAARMPMVVGWIRPVILLPAGAFAGVDARQLEAVLAHELAHIRRHDYLVNLLETAAETLLFYHPAVWWVGRRIRIEREHCCDDLAVSACGDVLTYARALTRLEELRANASPFAMAAGGGSLLVRIRRLLLPGQPAAERDATTWLGAILMIVAVVGIWTGALVARGEAQDARSPAPRQAATQPAASAQPGSFIGALADAGYEDLTVDQLIAFKIHGVTPAYILDLGVAGLRNLTPDQFIALRIHNVTPEFVRGLKAAGVTNLSADEVVTARIHAITPELVMEAVKMGFKDLTIDRLVHLVLSKILAAGKL